MAPLMLCVPFSLRLILIHLPLGNEKNINGEMDDEKEAIELLSM
jgi:hypothetical protein